MNTTNQTECDVVLDGSVVKCLRCSWWASAENVLLPVHRRCRGTAEPHRDGKKKHVRSEAEIMSILANHCQWCPFYNQPKQACELCGCPSAKNAKDYLRLRLRECPADRWTEAGLQQQMHQPPQPLADASMKIVLSTKEGPI